MFFVAAFLSASKAYASLPTPAETLLYEGQEAALWSIFIGVVITTLIYAFNALLSDFRPPKSDGMFDVLFNDFWLSRFITVKLNRIILFLNWWIYYSAFVYLIWCFVQAIIDWRLYIGLNIAALIFVIASRVGMEFTVAIIKIAENTDTSKRPDEKSRREE